MERTRPVLGVLNQFRLACYGKATRIEERELKLLGDFSSLRTELKRVPGATAAIRTQSKDLLEGVLELHQTFPVLDKDLIDRINTLLAAPYLDISGYPDIAEPVKASGEFMAQAEEIVEKVLTQVHRANHSHLAGGVFYSLCSPNVERVVSVEANADVWWAKTRKPEFGNSSQVWFTTLTTSVTLRAIQDPRWDFLDIGTGIGVYRFSSSGFDDFSGLVLEPIRLDLHGPTAWQQHRVLDIRRMLSLFTFRAGWIRVPDGFAAGAFSPDGAAIKPETQFTAGVFFNLNSLSRPQTQVASARP